MKQLPNAWRRVELGSVCGVQNGFPFKSENFNKSEGVPLIRVRSVKAQSCDIRYKGDFDNNFVVNNDDILIGMDGDFRPCWWKGGKALLNQRVSRLVDFADNVEPYFLYHAIYAHLKRIEDVTHFTTVKHLSASQIRSVEIELPPLPEQRAIADSLRSIQETLDARTTEIQLEREHKAALMAHLFARGTRGVATVETPLGNLPKNWEVVKMEDICIAVQYGTSEKCGDDSSEIPVIRIPNIVDEKLNDTNLKYSAFEPKVIEKLRLRLGDIIFVRTNGNKDYTGRCAVYEGQPETALFASYLIRAQLQQDKALPQFVQIYSSTPKGRSYLGGRASNAADGKFNINSQTIRSMLVPLPPLEEQREIAAILRACDDKIAALEEEATRLEELFRAMLEELMSGRISVAALIESQPTL